jgi:hypothetical protein
LRRVRPLRGSGIRDQRTEDRGQYSSLPQVGRGWRGGWKFAGTWLFQMIFDAREVSKRSWFHDESQMLYPSPACARRETPVKAGRCCSPLPPAGEGARRAGEGRRFGGNERLGKLSRRPSSAFGTFSPEGRRETFLLPCKRKSAPQSRGGFETRPYTAGRSSSLAREGRRAFLADGVSNLSWFYDEKNFFQTIGSA